MRGKEPDSLYEEIKREWRKETAIMLCEDYLTDAEYYLTEALSSISRFTIDEALSLCQRAIHSLRKYVTQCKPHKLR